MGLATSKPYIIDEVPSDDDSFDFDNTSYSSSRRGTYESAAGSPKKVGRPNPNVRLRGHMRSYGAVPTEEEKPKDVANAVEIEKVANEVRRQNSEDTLGGSIIKEVDQLMLYLDQADCDLGQRSERHIDNLDPENKERDMEDLEPLVVPDTQSPKLAESSSEEDTMKHHLTDDSDGGVEAQNIEEQLKAMAKLDRELQSFESHEEESLNGSFEQHEEVHKPHRKSGIPKLQSSRQRTNSTCSEESEPDRVKVRGRSMSPAKPGAQRSRGSGIPRLGGSRPLVRLASCDNAASARNNHFTYTTCDNCGVRIYTRHFAHNGYH